MFPSSSHSDRDASSTTGRPATEGSHVERTVRMALENRLRTGKLELPLLPDTAARVIAACSDETCDARGLADILQSDQSLAAHLLRVANSAAYSPAEPIVSLSQALSRLGFGTVCQIALAVSLKGRVFDVRGHEARFRDLWRHSGTTAGFAKEVARLRRRNVEGAFLAGLLHDVGHPVVLETVMGFGRSGPMFTALLDRLTAEFHMRVGMLLVERWSLPDWMRAAIEFHHDPAQAGEHAGIAWTICLADQLSHWGMLPEEEGAEREAGLRTHPALAALGLYPEDVDLLLGARASVLATVEAFE